MSQQIAFILVLSSLSLSKYIFSLIHPGFNITFTFFIFDSNLQRCRQDRADSSQKWFLVSCSGKSLLCELKSWQQPINPDTNVKGNVVAISGNLVACPEKPESWCTDFHFLCGRPIFGQGGRSFHTKAIFTRQLFNFRCPASTLWTVQKGK